MGVSAISRGGGGIHLPPCTGGDLDPVANMVNNQIKLDLVPQFLGPTNPRQKIDHLFLFPTIPLGISFLLKKSILKQ